MPWNVFAIWLPRFSYNQARYASTPVRHVWRVCRDDLEIDIGWERTIAAIHCSDLLDILLDSILLWSLSYSILSVLYLNISLTYIYVLSTSRASPESGKIGQVHWTAEVEEAIEAAAWGQDCSDSRHLFWSFKNLKRNPKQSQKNCSQKVFCIHCIRKCKVVAVAWLILIRFEALSDYFTKLSDQPWSYDHIVAVTSMHHHEEG